MTPGEIKEALAAINTPDSLLALARLNNAVKQFDMGLIERRDLDRILSACEKVAAECEDPGERLSILRATRAADKRWIERLEAENARLRKALESSLSANTNARDAIEELAAIYKIVNEALENG